MLSRRDCLTGMAGLAGASLVPGSAFAAAETAGGWPVWRGPGRDNVAAAGTTAPPSLDASRIKWRTSIPGRGHSTPVVVGDRLFMTTADEKAGTQSVVAVGADGTALWTKLVHRGGLLRQIHPNNTQASPSIASDGENLFAVFAHDDRVTLSSLTLDGRARWQEDLGPFRPEQYQFGYGPSPTLYGDTVIVAVEFDGSSFLTARDAATGAEVWRTPRPGTITFSSPIVAEVGGREQLLISGSYQIDSYDPATGKPLWSTEGTTSATCGTMVWDGGLVFASGGYPTPGTFAVKADGSGTVVWQNRQKCYEQSMLAFDGYVYGVTDSAVAHCWRASDGKTMWRERFAGSWSSSPLLVENRIYVVNEGGQAYVFEANAEEFTPVSTTQVADECFASPIAVGDTLYLRVANGRGARRQEELVAYA